MAGPAVRHARRSRLPWRRRYAPTRSAPSTHSPPSSRVAADMGVDVQAPCRLLAGLFPHHATQSGNSAGCVWPAG
ncbi:hypothetical protein ACFPRL_24650 [Pseudoclavibacter helvolus]